MGLEGAPIVEICVLERGNRHFDVFPQKATSGSAGFDLVADLEQELLLAPGQREVIPTGVKIALPDNRVGLIFARSGLSVKRGLMLANGVGVIDADYRGEIGCAVVNMGTEAVLVQPGMRIAQLLIVGLCSASLQLVDELGSTQRGPGGFGSTGC